MEYSQAFVPPDTHKLGDSRKPVRGNVPKQRHLRTKAFKCTETSIHEVNVVNQTSQPW